IRDFGEERNAKRIAALIVRERQKKMIFTTSHLAEIIRRVSKPPYQNKSLARVFQAFRIAVNQELECLKEVLPKAISILKKGGHIAVLSYHSIEDRIVKRFFQKQAKGCICPDEFYVCVCNVPASLKIITKKPLSPEQSEIGGNPRARSAKLRVAEKI
ncbi:MAG: 16S rRNA (cytosine(1402)-N(4))-methyltransferase RsmH, partial [Candidatus Zixiibacteriota bacterium]